jgi:sialate O-acetylesterase
LTIATPPFSTASRSVPPTIRRRIASIPFPESSSGPGRNVITVRVLDSGGGGGFRGKPESMHLDGPTSLPLAGDWSYKASLPLAEAPPVPLQVTGNHNSPTGLYNGMIHPLVPVAIKGAIWYQARATSAAPPSTGGCCRS